MDGYTKLYSSIVFSTIWREDDKTRLVWITMLAIADENGDVKSSIPGLSDAARVSIKECESSLSKLSSPDKYSRSKEKEGRRIIEIDGGWNIVNRNKYRDIPADRTEYWREYKRKQREKKSTVDKVDKVESPPVSTQAEAEAEAEENKNINSEFETFRKQYPGKKRGYEPEFEDFCRKHKDWQQILSLLIPSLSAQMRWRNAAMKEGAFVPVWKNLKTWLNQSCWTEEQGEIQFAKPPKSKGVSGEERMRIINESAERQERERQEKLAKCRIG